MTHLVAVYGTLKAGNSNYSLMEDSGARHVVTTVTKNRYQMFDGGFPMVSKAAPETPVHVEVYEVDTLQQLDWLEGHPDHFCRERVEVVGHEEHPWMYFGPEYHGRAETVKDGNWQENESWY